MNGMIDYSFSEMEATPGNRNPKMPRPITPSFRPKCCRDCFGVL